MPRVLADSKKRTITLETQTRTIDLPVDGAGRLVRYQPLPMAVEERAADGGTTHGFKGQVTPFGVRTWIGSKSWGFWEENEPGAFSKTIREKRGENNDITLNREHDNQFILARTSNGSLRLTEDDAGLQADADMGDYSYARDAVLAIQRRDLTGMSYAFSMVTYEWSIADDGKDLLRHREIELFDTAVVGMPAYADTTADLRSGLLAAARSQGFDVAAFDRLAERLATPDPELIEALRALSLDAPLPAPGETTRDRSPADATDGMPAIHPLAFATLARRMSLQKEFK